MKNTDISPEIPSLQLPGKKFLLVLVVFISAVSFTLGYFVGKSGTDSRLNDLSQAAAHAGYSQIQETPPQPGSMAGSEKSAGLEETGGKQGETRQLEPFVVVEEKQPSAAANPQPAAGKGTVRTVAQEPVKASVEKPAGKNSLAETDVLKSKGSSTKEPLYTVQMGAFKSSAEAESFRKKYAKKRIKTFVVTAVSEKKQKVYKVRTGEFKNRKEADLLSLKLSKTENLKTFVTAKSE